MADMAEALTAVVLLFPLDPDLDGAAAGRPLGRHAARTPPSRTAVPRVTVPARQAAVPRLATPRRKEIVRGIGGRAARVGYRGSAKGEKSKGTTYCL